MYKNNFVNFCITLAFLIALTTEEEIGPRSGHAGPSFSVRPEKEAKGAVSHGTSAAEGLRHVKNSSANLPKLDDSHRLKHMGRFVFAERVSTCRSTARCRSAVRGGRGGHSPTRVSLASFSLHRAKRMKSRQRNRQ
ncbi:MAG: hypothetical protein SPF51_08685, partial [Candidatus Fimivicinus sp.]|nr:hypothetical protein [Candidatus Fimivicinus sp.]